MRLTKKAREALKRYYTNRKRQGEVEWNKAADLSHIGTCLKGCRQPKVQYCEASAGTFLVSWSDNVQTVHNEENYWRESVLCRKVGEDWIKYRDCCGRKLEKPEKM